MKVTSFFSHWTWWKTNESNFWHKTVVIAQNMKGIRHQNELWAGPPCKNVRCLTSRIKWSSFSKLRRVCEEDTQKELCCAVSTSPTTFYPCESREVNDRPAAHVSSGMRVTGIIRELGMGCLHKKDILSWRLPHDPHDQ